MTVYEFVDTRGYWKGSAPVVCVASALLVRPLLDERELSDLFGGCVLYADRDSDLEYLGVWGARNASRYRAILRLRGASFALVKRLPENLAQKWRHTRPSSRSASGRASRWMKIGRGPSR